MKSGVRFAAFAIGFALLFVAPGRAQWLRDRTPGIPRTPDGMPDLSAPTPRAADGKPDLSGFWQGSLVYARNIASDLQAGDVQPWAEALTQERMLNFGKDSPSARCLPPPPAFWHRLVRIVQTPSVIVLLSEGVESNNSFRTIFTDGRALPKDRSPTWLGYSVGHWDADTLVVDTVGFNDQGWLDEWGHPQTETLRTTERFRRRDFGHIEFEVTIEDPTVFNRVFTVKMDKTLSPDNELLESVCENDRIAPHLVGGSGLRIAASLLSAYTGVYEIASGREAVVTAQGSLLFLQQGNAPKQPLVPRSETVFINRENGNEVEFEKDNLGAVIQLVLRRPGAADRRAVRKSDLAPGVRK
jgi:hypothetical protein